MFELDYSRFYVDRFYPFERPKTKYKPVKNEVIITETEEQILNRYKSKKKKRKSK